MIASHADGGYEDSTTSNIGESGEIHEGLAEIGSGSVGSPSRLSDPAWTGGVVG
jgi:hypothetical protein